MPSGALDDVEEGPSTGRPPLGALLRAWRERALLTQEQLATQAGLSVRTVRRLESGELRRPRSTSMRLLGEALGLDATELSVLIGAAGDVPRGPRPTRTTPRQLPADVAFVGRAQELALLDETGGAATVLITAIDGMAGVGKTALAVHAAHQLADRFPDGDLFVDLHGYTQGMTPADPADTLARVLGLLGVPGESIPQHVDDRAALYRTLLAERRMLIVLDNAADEAQVEPLLPGAGGCLVLITSRRRLVGLDGFRTVSVDVLPVGDAITLFTDTAGRERVAGVPREALAEMVRRCGLLPLAIRLAAARLKAHPSWSVEHLLERLEEHQSLLSELHAGQRSVTAALDLSYRELSAAERRAYRLLGSYVGLDLAAEAAAVLLATTPEPAVRLLDRLMEAHLLQEPAVGRYRLHDLIRAHAAAMAAREEPEAERRAALTRLLDHYGQAASAAMDRLYPYDADMRPHLPADTVSMPDEPSATAWLEAELGNLLALAQHAAGHGFPEHIRHLSATLHRCLRTRGRYAEAEALHRRALSAARATADRPGEMEALLGLGEIHCVRSRYETALEDTMRALDLARATGHQAGELRALHSLGTIRAYQGQFPPAAEAFTESLGIARAIGHRTGELDALIDSGQVYRLMERYEAAADHLTRALELARTIDHRTCESRALMGLGHTHLRRGRLGPAEECFSQALSLARSAGHRLGELTNLNGLGHLYREQGLRERALDCYEQAIDIAREIGNRNWHFEAVHGAGRLQYDSGHADEALESHREALDLASGLDQPSDQARAHDGLAHAHAALGRPAQARHHWTQALAIMAALGVDRTEERGVDVESIRAHLARLAPAAATDEP
ncbi:tetratricopeptide repeat protein [Nonomuraea sp. NPDC050643]|uniref:ATP-binding protein n=1 Tax=Nonomuraea sp. NPDC050643 TaxID=3155660 RepID=UPI0033C03C00